MMYFATKWRCHHATTRRWMERTMATRSNKSDDGDVVATNNDSKTSMETKKPRDTSLDKELFGSVAGFVPIDPKITNMNGIFPGGFRINGNKILGPVVLTRNLVLSWRGPSTSQ